MRNNKNFKSRWVNQLVDNIYIGVIVVDGLRRNLYVNSRFSEIFGYEEDELLEKSTEVLHINKESFENFGEIAFKSVLEGKPVNIDYQFKKKDGTQFWVHISGDLIANKEEVIWVIIDITERKLLEIQQYQQSQLIQQIQDGMVITNMDAIITDWNMAAQNMLGYTKEEVLGISTENMYLPQDHKIRQKNIQELLKNGVFRTERQLLSKSKELVEVELTASMLNDIHGNPIGMLGYFKDITSRKQIQEKVEYLASHDVLTSLPNRMLFHDRLKEGIKKAKREQNILALLFIDLDHFKKINDTLGHEVGDSVLKEVSKKLLKTLREKDTVSRLGGDEFTVIIEGFSNRADIAQLTRKILEVLSEAMEIEGNKLSLSSSIGIAIHPDDTVSDIDLLRFADIAMYHAKNSGRNNFQFYNAQLEDKTL